MIMPEFSCPAAFPSPPPKFQLHSLSPPCALLVSLSYIFPLKSEPNHPSSFTSNQSQIPQSQIPQSVDEVELTTPTIPIQSSISLVMETQNLPAGFTYMGRNFSELSLNDNSSSAFSDCNSDRSGEFTSASSESRQLWLACAGAGDDFSDDLIPQLVSNLNSPSIEEQKQAAMEIRLLAKNKPENRLKIARAGAIKPLISLLSSSDLQLQEYGVTAILNLSLCDENKDHITSSGAIKPLVKALKFGTATARENSACALLRLSQIDENKLLIGRSGAIPPLVDLLETGNFRGKKDASTALYSLCSVKENKIRAVEAGIMKPLIELMADFGSNMVDKSAYVLSLLVSVAEARAALVEEGGIPVLVEIVEVGTQRQKEIAAAILLQLCEDSIVYRTLVAREGAIPALVALSQSGTSRAKKKAETLIELLRQPRSGNAASRGI